MIDQGKLAGGSLMGDLFDLPAGPLSIATGFEWRKEESRATPDALTRTGLNAGNATPEASGAFSAKELFLEAPAPRLEDRAFAKSLTALGRSGQATIRPSGAPTAGMTNSGGEDTEGINVTARWNDLLGPGRANVRLAYIHVREGYHQLLPASERDPFVGEVNHARHKASLNLAYLWHGVNLQSTVSYIGRSYPDDQFLAQFDLPARSIGVGSRTYTDLQPTDALHRTTELYVGQDNVFDMKAPPIITGFNGQ